MQLSKDILKVEKKYSSLVAKAQKEAEKLIEDASTTAVQQEDVARREVTKTITTRREQDDRAREELVNKILSDARIQAQEFTRTKKREQLKKDLLDEVLNVSF